MVKTYPSYTNYLEENKVSEGSDEDPLAKLQKVILKEGADKMIDIICPFFCVVGNLKGEDIQIINTSDKE